MTLRPSLATAIATIALLTALLAPWAEAQTPAPVVPPPPSAPAPAAPAGPAQSSPTPDVELERVASFMTGSFDTFAQVAADQATGASYTHLRAVMSIVPTVVPGLDAPPGSRAFYVEQAVADALDKPYRQRVYLLARRDGVLSNRIYRITEPADLVGAPSHPELLARLSASRLTAEEGCDVVWTRVTEAQYTGITGLNNTCKTAWRGADHAVSQVMLTPTSITSLDEGFDAAGKHVWGPKPGTLGHVFSRRGATPAVELAQEFAKLRAGDGSRDVVWAFEGTVYTVNPDGTLTATGGIVGFNAARAVPGAGGDVRVTTKEVFALTDVERKTILKERPPRVTSVDFGIGVRDGKSMVGLGFTTDGADSSSSVPPVEILTVTTDKARRFFTLPLVNVAAGPRRYWALEGYDFVVPTGPAAGEPYLVWQRDTERQDGTLLHFVAHGRQLASLDALAASSPLMRELVSLVPMSLTAVSGTKEGQK